MNPLTNDLAVACTLGPETIKTRAAGLLPGLVARADACERLSNGYRLRFTPAGDLLTAIATTVNAERQCCRFLRFELTIEPAGGPVWMDVTGPEGTSEFLTALIEGM